MASRSSRTCPSKQAANTESQKGVDLSLLQKPIELGISGALQVAKCLSGGTAEMRELLLEECDLVFECRICRNLFRSLANFIAHKRVYCQECYSDRNLHLVESKPSHQTLLVQPEPPKETAIEKKACAASKTQRKTSTDSRTSTESKSSHGKRNVEKNKSNDQDENGGEEKRNIKRVTKTNDSRENGVIVCEGKSEEFQFYSKVVERQKLKKEDLSSTLVELDDVKGNKNAKRQRVVLEAGEDEVKQASKKRRGPSHADLALISENIDSHRFESGQDSIWSGKDSESNQEPGRRINLRTRGGDGEVTNPIAIKLSHRKDCDVKTQTCLKCKTKYSSLKTLNFHMMSLHAEKQTFFPCLYCKSTFTQMWPVMRHMQKSHRCSKEYIDKVKSVIKKNSFTKAIDDLDENDGQCNTGRSTMSGHTLRVKKTARNEEHRDRVEKMEKKASDTFLQVTRKLKDKIRGEKGRTVEFGTGFSLHKCLNCKKAFAKKDSLSRHQAFCFGLEDQIAERKRPKAVSSAGKANKHSNETNGNIRDVIEIKKQKGLSNELPRSESIEEKREDKSKVQVQVKEKLETEEEMETQDVEPSTKVEEKAGENSEPQKTETITNTPVKAPASNIENQCGNGSPEEAAHAGTDVSREESLKFQLRRKLTEVEDRDIERVRKMINEETLECLKCNRKYGSISNLHRHVVRHLGWRRFRCTLCEFTAYNRSECKTHLHRVHLEKTSSNLNRFILDLEPGKLKAGVSSLSRVEAKRPSSVRILERMQHARQQAVKQRHAQVGKTRSNSGEPRPGHFNISTRMSPRKYDITPFQSSDSGGLMFTRSGSYMKLPVKQEPVSSDEETSENEDENPKAGNGVVDSDIEFLGERKKIARFEKQNGSVQSTIDTGNGHNVDGIATEQNGFGLESDIATGIVVSSESAIPNVATVPTDGELAEHGNDVVKRGLTGVIENVPAVTNSEVILLVMDGDIQSEGASSLTITTLPLGPTSQSVTHITHRTNNAAQEQCYEEGSGHNNKDSDAMTGVDSSDSVAPESNA